MISIVIPAYNEEKLIGDCLQGLVDQTTNQEFEVILVDNASTDRTRQVAEKFKSKLNLRIIEEEHKGRGTARFAGFNKAKGTIIFSTDADTVAPSDWIERFTEELNNGDCVAVSGTIAVNDVGTLKNYAINNLLVPIMTSYRLSFGHYWINGFSSAIFKDIYMQSGGFNPTLNTQEDIDLSFRVSKIGKIKLIKDTPVIFSGRRFRNGVLIGFLPYVKTYISYFWLNGKNVKLEDVR